MTSVKFQHKTSNRLFNILFPRYKAKCVELCMRLQKNRIKHEMPSREYKKIRFIAVKAFFIVSVLSGLLQHKQAVTKAVICSQQVTSVSNTRWYLYNNIFANSTIANSLRETKDISILSAKNSLQNSVAESLIVKPTTLPAVLYERDVSGNKRGSK